MTWIFLSPAALRTTSKVRLTSSASRPRQPRRRRRRRHHHAASGGFDAVGFLEVVREIDRLLEGEADELVAEFLDVFSTSAMTSSPERVSWPNRVEHSSRPRARLTAKRFNP